MLSLIKADLYRILRGKAIYITLVGLVLYIVLEISALNFIATSELTAGIMSEVSSEMGDSDMLAMTGFTIQMTGINCLVIFVSMAQNIMYLLLPAAIVVAGTDFNIGTVKNILSRGCTRIKYFFSKYLLITLINIALLIIGYIVAFLIGTVLHGVGTDATGVTSSYMANVIKAALLCFLPYLGYSSVAVFLVFLFKRTASSIAFYFLFGTIPVLIVTLLTLYNSKLDILADIFLYNAFSSILNIVNEGVTNSVIIGIVVSLCYILLSMCGSFLVFKQAEIK